MELSQGSLGDNTRALEKNLSEALGMDVMVWEGQGEAGQFIIDYKTLDQLDFVCGRLRGG